MKISTKLRYNPNPQNILSSMRERLNMLSQELYNGDMPHNVQHAFEIAWREACLHCLSQIDDAAQMVSSERIDWHEPARLYLERVYEEIMKDNALSPFINYEE